MKHCGYLFLYAVLCHGRSAGWDTTLCSPIFFSRREQFLTIWLDVRAQSKDSYEDRTRTINYLSTTSSPRIVFFPKKQRTKPPATSRAGGRHMHKHSCHFSPPARAAKNHAPLNAPLDRRLRPGPRENGDDASAPASRSGSPTSGVKRAFLRRQRRCTVVGGNIGNRSAVIGGNVGSTHGDTTAQHGARGRISTHRTSGTGKSIKRTKRTGVVGVVVAGGILSGS